MIEHARWQGEESDLDGEDAALEKAVRRGAVGGSRSGEAEADLLMFFSKAARENRRAVDALEDEILGARQTQATVRRILWACAHGSANEAQQESDGDEYVPEDAPKGKAGKRRAVCRSAPLRLTLGTDIR